MATVPAGPASRAALKPARHVELQTLIHTALIDLVDNVNAAVRLITERPVGGPGFLTPDGRQARDKAVRAERQARYVNQLAGLEMPGESPAPLNAAAVSIEPETRTYLASVVDELQDELHRAGVCWIHETWWARTDPRKGEHSRNRHRDVADLALEVSALVRFVRRPARLEPIHRSLEDLVTRARRVVVGEDRTTHPDPCPHCRRRSLVAYLTLGTIRCEHDPDTGRREPCICIDMYCPCHAKTGYRHEWHRAERAHKTTSWQGLRRDQRDAQRREDEMTDALAAIERIRTLHTPTWTDSEGTEHTTYGYVAWDEAPIDHVCVIGPYDQCVVDDMHAVPCCSECRAPGDDGPVYHLWPCATIRALDEPDEDDTTEGAHP